MALVIGFCALLAGSWLVLKTWPRVDRAELVRSALSRTPPSTIASAPEGALVRVRGRLRLAGTPLTSPISGRPCAGFEVHVIDVSLDDAGRPRDRLRNRDLQLSDFYLDDDSGAALVRAAGADASLVLDRLQRAAMCVNERPEMQAFLQRVYLEPGRVGIDYHEGVLEAGETVTVAGLARWQSGAGDAPYRAAARQLTLEAPPKGRVLVSDWKRL